MSHHLKVLYDAGLLERDRRGTWVYYRIVPEQLAALRDALAAPDEAPPGEMRRVEAVMRPSRRSPAEALGTALLLAAVVGSGIRASDSAGGNAGHRAAGQHARNGRGSGRR